MNINKFDKWIVRIAYLYIFLPVFVFFAGWCRYYVSIPGCLLILAGLFNMCRDDMPCEGLNWNRSMVKKAVIIMMIIAVWVFLSGIGGYVWQTADHGARNGIFEVMVKEPWPVIKTVDGIERGLIYYIGFWMVPSLIGKVFGVAAGYFAQYMWTVIGILLFYYFVCLLRKRVVIWPLLVFIMFSGWDIVGMLAVGNWEGFTHMEWWGEYFQYSSFTTQLFWVFNQAVPAWLITIVIYMQKKNRYIVFLLSAGLLHCTLPFIGMIPFTVYFMLGRNYDQTENKLSLRIVSLLKDTFSPENVFCGGFVGILSFIYLVGNIAGQNLGLSSAGADSFLRPMVVQAAELDEKKATTETTEEYEGNEDGYETIQIINTKNRMLMYVLFVTFEVLIYIVFLHVYRRRDKLLSLVTVWLLICPFIRVGYAYDFCMRASIPALVILYLLLVETMDTAIQKKERAVTDLFVAVLLIGSLTVGAEFKNTIVNTNQEFRKNGITVLTEDVILVGSNFSGELEHNVFYQYIAK